MKSCGMHGFAVLLSILATCDLELESAPKVPKIDLPLIDKLPNISNDAF